MKSKQRDVVIQDFDRMVPTRRLRKSGDKAYAVSFDLYPSFELTAPPLSFLM